MNGVRHPDLFGFVQPKVAPISIGSEESESTLVGRYAEFMVCAYLTKLGHRALHVDSAGFDIIMDYDGNTFRIDVKSSRKNHSGPFKQSALWGLTKAQWREGEPIKRRRPVGPADCDILALFYAPLDAVAFYPVSQPTTQARIPLRQLRNDVMGNDSLEIAVQSKLRERMGIL